MSRALFLALLALGTTFNNAGANPVGDVDRQAIEQIVREYLLANPEVVMEAAGRFQAKQAEEAQQKQADALVELRDAVNARDIPLILGDAGADVSVVEFSDYNCGFCRRSFPVLGELVEKDPRTNVLLKELPVLGPVSTFASRAALAARAQGKYAEFHAALMTTTESISEESVMAIAEGIGLDRERLEADMQSEHIERELQENLALAQALGITGTPAFIIGDQIIPGAVSASRLAAVVKRVRAQDEAKSKARAEAQSARSE